MQKGIKKPPKIRCKIIKNIFEKTLDKQKSFCYNITCSECLLVWLNGRAADL